MDGISAGLFEMKINYKIGLNTQIKFPCLYSISTLIYFSSLQEEEEANEDIPAILVRHGVDTDIWVQGPDQCEQTLLHKAIGKYEY